MCRPITFPTPTSLSHPATSLTLVPPLPPKCLPPPTSKFCLPACLSLLGLPLEIKTEIVNMVRAQDLAYGVRVPRPDVEDKRSGGSTARRGTVEGRRPFLWRTGSSASWRPCISSLHVSGFIDEEAGADELGVPEVRSKRAREKDFTYFVMPNRAGHIVHARVDRYINLNNNGEDDEEGSEAVAWFISILHFFPNLSTFTACMVDVYWLELDDPAGDIYSRGAFTTAAKRIQHLVLDDVILSVTSPALHAASILRQFPYLRCLSLASIFPGEWECAFLQTVAALAHLQSLDLATTRWTSRPTDWTAINWTTHNLRHLRIQSRSLHDHLPLLCAFSATLDRSRSSTLTLPSRSFPSSPPSARPPFPTSIPSPQRPNRRHRLPLFPLHLVLLASSAGRDRILVPRRYDILNHLTPRYAQNIPPRASPAFDPRDGRRPQRPVR